MLRLGKSQEGDRRKKVTDAIRLDNSLEFVMGILSSGGFTENGKFGTLATESERGQPASFVKPRRHILSKLLGTCAFFCSNASIALARSLCKCLLAVLITASEADTVASSLDSWCRAVWFHSTKKTKRNKNQNRSTTNHNNKQKHRNQTWNEPSKTTWNVMTRQLVCYDSTPRVEAITALASLAVISTANKHLHNDLARAIMALEQKKQHLLYPFPLVHSSSVSPFLYSLLCLHCTPRQGAYCWSNDFFT